MQRISQTVFYLYALCNLFFFNPEMLVLIFPQVYCPWTYRENLGTSWTFCNKFDWKHYNFFSNDYKTNFLFPTAFSTIHVLKKKLPVSSKYANFLQVHK